MISIQITNVTIFTKMCIVLLIYANFVSFECSLSILTALSRLYNDV